MRNKGKTSPVVMPNQQASPASGVAPSAVSPQHTLARPLPHEELRTALRELDVAQEELRVQNEALMQMYQAVEAEHQRYQDLFARAPEAYLVTDLNGVIQEANRAAISLLHISLRRVNRPLALFIPQNERAAFRSQLARLCRGERDSPQLEWTLRLQPYKESPFDALAMVHVHWDPGSQKDILYWTLRDITEHKQTQQALRESEAQFQATFENAAVGIAHVGLDGRWLRVNAKLVEITGYTREELLAKTIQDITHPDNLEEDMAQRRRLLVDEIPTFSLEKRYIHRDSRIVWINLTVSLMRRPDGAPDYFISIIEDISARKQAETALRESEERFRKVFENAPMGIAITDWEGRFQQCNPAYSALLGYTEEELYQARFAALLHPEDRETNLTELRRLQTGELPFFEIENRYVHKNGHPVWVHKFVSILRDETGKPAHMVALITNITERKRAEQAALNQTNALIHTLSALKAEPGQDAFLGRVLSSLAETLHAQLALLSLIHLPDAALSAYLLWENGKLSYPKDRDSPFAAQPVQAHLYPLWQEMLQTRSPVFVQDAVSDPRVRSKNWIRAKQIVSFVVTPMLVDEEPVGGITVFFARSHQLSAQESALIQALAQQAAIVIQMSRLADQGRQAAVLQERNRLAQEIHDTLAQGFTGILIQLQAALRAPGQEQMRAHIRQGCDLARDSLQEARRSVRALRPQALEANNLPGALIHFIQQMNSSAPTATHFAVHGTVRPLYAEMENDLFRIGQEALTNALKHAEADEIQIDLAFEEDRVRLTVRDNGRGFNIHSDFQGNGFGLIGMHERTERHGGEMRISSKPGQGTLLTIVLPLLPVPLKGDRT